MLRPPPLTRTLAAALRDATHAKESVRVSAVTDLGVLMSDDARVAAALESALTSDRSVEVRAAAALALANGEARASVPHLVRAANDAPPRVRQMALLALGELAQGELATGDPSGVVAALQAALRDPLPALRFQALSSLVSLGLAVEEHLAHGLQDGDTQVRLLALRLLWDRAQQPAPAAPRPASSALLELVQQHLSDPAPSLRLAAALVAADAERAQAEQVVCAVLNDARVKLELEDEQRAIDYCAEARLHAAMPGLRRRAQRGFWSTGLSQWPARAVLALLGDPLAKQQILDGLSGWTWQTRTQAVLAAGRAQLVEAEAHLQALAANPNSADPDAVAEALRQIAQRPIHSAAEPSLVNSTQLD